MQSIICWLLYFKFARNLNKAAEIQAVEKLFISLT